VEDVLQRIQQLQFTDKQAAEQMVLTFVRESFELDVIGVELRPLAVSLNSFNGFLTLADRSRLFFKTHTESRTIISEYYSAGTLAEAGYPIVQPLYSSTEVGKQLLIYEVIDDQSVFDIAWSIEGGDGDSLPDLQAAQVAGDMLVSRIYQNTLGWQTAEQAEGAVVHQLFHHRLAGGRLADFYGAPARIALPGGEFDMADVRRAHWTINGQRYDETLDDLIVRATTLLEPAQAGPAISGHGDAHNGNVFFQRDRGSLLYFDPAFAGRHHPLLDLAKPVFHNVFAMWMYFPADKQRSTAIDLHRQGDRFEVTYQYDLPPVRHMFLDSKVDNVLIPVLRELQGRGWLRADWREYFKAALLCCPLLTMNLADPVRFPPEISLIGLANAVEMGGNSHGRRSLIDHVLDGVQRALDVTAAAGVE
jgi:hypothetical protein